eukprot:jgi/Tetstr1/421782/TSEL_012685.t1
MAGGKKAADPTKATPADSLAETPAEPTETTRDMTTLALLQALALKTAPPPSSATHPSLWRPRNDEANRYLTEANKTASRDEYRHMLCYGVYRAAADAAAKTIMATLRAPDTPTQDRVDALDLLDAAHRTLEAVGDADEARLTYLRRFKNKKVLTPEEQVAERLIYSRVFNTAEHERSANVVDGLLAALEDKRLEVGLAVVAKAEASATFKKQAAERDTDRDKARKEKDKAARERREQQRREAGAKNRDKNGGMTGDKTRDIRCGAPRRQLLPRLRLYASPRQAELAALARHRRDRARDELDTGWRTRAFPLQPATPKVQPRRLVQRRNPCPTQVPHRRAKTLYGGRRVGEVVVRMVGVPGVLRYIRNIPKPGDNQWRFITGLRVLDTFCARKRLRMETLMGVRHLATKGDYMFSFDLQDGFYALGIAPSDRDYFTVNIRGTLYRLCGLPMGWPLSPYYFTTFTMTFVKHLRSPTTPAAPGNVPRSRRWLRGGRWRGARILPYVDDFLLFASSEPEARELRHRVADLLDSLGLLRNPANKWLWEPVQYGQHLGVDIDTATGYFYAPVDKLQRLARQAKQLLQRAARDARWLPMRELQSLAGRAQYLFLAIPAARFYLRELHDVVGSKWGGRVRMTHQLRRDLQWWTAVPTQANGRPIHRLVETAYMHCDSSGYGWGAVLNGRLEARGVLANLTSCSLAMMAELRKLWYLLDCNSVHTIARYIRSAANVWVDRLSRHLDSDDWQLDPVMFAKLEAMWGAYSVDRFASALNAMLPRYNAAWLDPGCEAVDSLHLSDAEWRRENNYCNPPWPLLPDLVQKLHQSGEAATVVAPRWEGKVWH